MQHGVNAEAQPLHLHEIEVMRTDDAIQQRCVVITGCFLCQFPQKLYRLIRAYKLMLDFFGLRLDFEFDIILMC